MRAKCQVSLLSRAHGGLKCMPDVRRTAGRVQAPKVDRQTPKGHWKSITKIRRATSPYGIWYGRLLQQFVNLAAYLSLHSMPRPDPISALVRDSIHTIVIEYKAPVFMFRPSTFPEGQEVLEVIRSSYDYHTHTHTLLRALGDIRYPTHPDRRPRTDSPGTEQARNRTGALRIDRQHEPLPFAKPNVATRSRTSQPHMNGNMMNGNMHMNIAKGWWELSCSQRTACS